MRKLALGAAAVLAAAFALGWLAFACATAQPRSTIVSVADDVGPPLSVSVGAPQQCLATKIDLTEAADLKIAPNCRYEVTGLFDRVLPPSEKAEFAADAAVKFGGPTEFDIVLFQRPRHFFWIIPKSTEWNFDMLSPGDRLVVSGLLVAAEPSRPHQPGAPVDLDLYFRAESVREVAVEAGPPPALPPPARVATVVITLTKNQEKAVKHAPDGADVALTPAQLKAVKMQWPEFRDKTATITAEHVDSDDAVALTMKNHALTSIGLAPAAGEKPAPVERPGMVPIRGGAFMMGCSPDDADCTDPEKPRHQATVNAFWMDAKPVTNAAYVHCVAEGACQRVDQDACYKHVGADWRPGGGSLDETFQGETQPVVCVDWADAAAFCKWRGKRLPTEAEWEFAARGGVTGARYGQLDAVAWYASNSGGRPQVGGMKQPNAYGLYDMLGNVWEWCSDWYDENYYASSPASNPKGPAAGSARVLRGGSYSAGASFVRASYRYKFKPAERFAAAGFRCVQD